MAQPTAPAGVGGPLGQFLANPNAGAFNAMIKKEGHDCGQRHENGATKKAVIVWEQRQLVNDLEHG